MERGVFEATRQLSGRMRLEWHQYGYINGKWNTSNKLWTVSRRDGGGCFLAKYAQNRFDMTELNDEGYQFVEWIRVGRRGLEFGMWRKLTERVERLGV